MSNGGLLAQRLACALAGRIAAVASVAGAVPFSGCEARVPILLVHGTDDPILPFAGARESEAQWAARDGCKASRREVLHQGDALCEAREGCVADVELCTIEGGGHAWPGGVPLPGLGATSRDLDATARIAAFFARH
jgi:polyhydroxybutyrate depolymerase